MKKMTFKPYQYNHGFWDNLFSRTVGSVVHESGKVLELLKSIDINDGKLGVPADTADFIKMYMISDLLVKSKTPMLHIFLTDEMCNFLLSSVSENVLRDPTDEVIDGSVKLEDLSDGFNEYGISKICVESSSDLHTHTLHHDRLGISYKPMIHFGGWLPDCDMNYTSLKHQQSHDKHRRLHMGLSLYLEAFDDALQDVTPSEVKHLNHHTGRCVRLREFDVVREDNHNAKSAHFRRGHFRRLDHDRYKKKRVVFVKGCFVKGRAMEATASPISI